MLEVVVDSFCRHDLRIRQIKINPLQCNSFNILIWYRTCQCCTHCLARLPKSSLSWFLTCYCYVVWNGRVVDFIWRSSRQAGVMSSVLCAFSGLTPKSLRLWNNTISNVFWYSFESVIYFTRLLGVLQMAQTGSRARCFYPHRFFLIWLAEMWRAQSSSAF